LRSAFYWIKFGVCMAVALTMLVFGALFMRHVYIALWLDNGELALLSLLFGVLLFLTGGGLLFTTVVHSIKRVTRNHLQLP
jgi:hypothetical protein